MSKHFGSLEITELLKIKGGSPSAGDLLKITSIDSEGFAIIDYDSSSSYVQDLQNAMDLDSELSGVNSITLESSSSLYQIGDVVNGDGGFAVTKDANGFYNMIVNGTDGTADTFIATFNAGSGNVYTRINSSNGSLSPDASFVDFSNSGVKFSRIVNNNLILDAEVDHNENGLGVGENATVDGYVAISGPKSFMPKQWVQTTTVRVARATISFLGSIINIGGLISANSIISKVTVQVKTVFNGSPTLDIGISGDTNAVMANSEIDLTNTSSDVKLFSGYTNSSDFQLQGVLNSGGATQGEIIVYIEYYG